MLSQDYPELEYFILDGGSTDATVSAIREYESNIDWWVSEPDDGQVSAINKGFMRASGELLAWVNSDDVLLPGCLHAIARIFQRKSRPDIIHANCVYIDENGGISRCVRTPRQTHFWMRRGVWYASAPAIFFRRQMLKNHGYLDTRYHLSMDVDIWVKLMSAGARVTHIPTYLGAFRWHPDSKTTQAKQSRGNKRRENPETEVILNTALRGSTQTRRWRWRWLWQVSQVFNLNYLRAKLDTHRLRGRYWRDAFAVAGSEVV